MTDRERREARALWRQYSRHVAPGAARPAPAPGRLAAYIEGRAAPEVRDEVERWLAATPEALDEVCALAHLLEHSSTEKPPAVLLERAKALVSSRPAGVQAGEGSGAENLFKQVAYWTAMAASLAIVAWAGCQTGFQTGRDQARVSGQVAHEMLFGLGDHMGL